MDGYNAGVSEPGDDEVISRELVFMCADTGAVITLSFIDGKRTTLARAVVFLASGDTLWIDGTAGPGTGSPLAVQERSAGGQYDLRVSAQATLLSGPADPLSGEPAPGRPIPLGLDLSLESASQLLALGPADQVSLLRGTGSLAADSVIRPVAGTGWLSAGPGGGPGGQAGGRARAVFQDGSALYVAGETGDGTGNDTADGPVAALVRNAHIRPARVRDLTMREARHGQAGRTVSWATAGRSPAAASAEIRDSQQQLMVKRPDAGGLGWRSWRCAPYVFVRSGVTGLGLVERRDRLAAAAGAAEPSSELPNPY
jgi:hypothetical protein